MADLISNNDDLIRGHRAKINMIYDDLINYEEIKKFINEYKIEDVFVKMYGYDDVFVQHGSVEELEKLYGLDAKSIALSIQILEKLQEY